eukprot:409794_1
MTDKIELGHVTPRDIENMLDEIHQNESPFDIKQQTLSHDDDNIDWDEILQKITNGNIAYIKKLISSNEIEINAQNPINGMTLLMYSVVIGNLDLVSFICNFGGDVHICDNDGDTALSHAIRFGRYKITELLYYRQLSGKVGSDLKNIAMALHRKNKEAAFLNQHMKIIDKEPQGNNKFKAIGHMNIMQKQSEGNNKFKFQDFMIKAIEQRKPFGDDMLFYAWYFVLHDNGERRDSYNRFYKEKVEPLESKLFKTMMKTYQDILSNTSDIQGWKWMKHWFLPHPVNSKHENKQYDDDGDAQDDDMESILRNTLFFELLIRVRAESKKQSDELLKEKIDAIKTDKIHEWNQLTTYHVNTKYSKTARQDLSGCLLSKYTESDLSEDIYPPSTHFIPKKHYDQNIYLNNLMFRGNILDTMFQRDMKRVTQKINLETGDNVHFTAGPVKTLARAQTKVVNSYINEDWPTSARILDINRCALHFENIKTLMKFIKIFVLKVKARETFSVVEIIRCKNGWSIWNSNCPAYTDIKLNVLIQSPIDTKKKIIAEIQFLLKLMSQFKKKAHKLYSVERKSDLIYNFGQLTTEMSRFKDVNNLNNVFINVIDNDNVKQFKLLWNSCNLNVNVLFDNEMAKDCSKAALFHIIKNQNSKINKYFTNECPTKLCEAIVTYFNKYVEKTMSYSCLFNHIVPLIDGESEGIQLTRFLNQTLDLIGDDIKTLKKFLFIKSNTNDIPAFLGAICYCREWNKALIFMLETNRISDKMKVQLLFHNIDNNAFTNAFQTTYATNILPILHYIQNDGNLLRKAVQCKFNHNSQTITKNICESKDPLSTNALLLLLNNDLLTEYEKLNMFLEKNDDDRDNSAMHYA